MSYSIIYNVQERKMAWTSIASERGNTLSSFTGKNALHTLNLQSRSFFSHYGRSRPCTACSGLYLFSSAGVLDCPGDGTVLTCSGNGPALGTDSLSCR